MRVLQLIDPLGTSSHGKRYLSLIGEDGREIGRYYGERQKEIARLISAAEETEPKDEP